MLDILLQQMTSTGGAVLAALAALSVAATAVTIVKVIQFAQMGVGRHDAANAAIARWMSGDGDGSLRQAATDGSALSQVVAAALSCLVAAPENRDRARDAATQTAIQALNRMTSHLRMLDAVVQAAPMLGLLGTVIGMIDAFGALSQSGGAVDPGALAQGIWIALTTTAVGLAVAIPFYFVSVWLEDRTERERAAIELAIAAIVNRHPGSRIMPPTRPFVAEDFRTVPQAP